MWRDGEGIIRSFNTWLLLECGREIARYYCALHNREYPYKDKIQPPLWGGHISIIRGETLLDSALRAELEGMSVSYRYKTEMNTNAVHFYLPVQCPLLSDIRLAFGLGPTLVSYHLSVGNRVSELKLARSKNED